MFIRDLYAQLDLCSLDFHSVYARPVGSGGSLFCLFETCRLMLDLYSVYTRPVGSAGYILCLYDTCRLSWIYIVILRDIYTQIDIYSVYSRHVVSVGSP